MGRLNSMSRERLIKRNGKWYDLLKDDVPPLHHADAAPMVMGDLPDYRPVAADKETGKRPMIGGRRQHREFLQRNGYIEVGNETGNVRREELHRRDRMSDIRRALGE